MTRFATRLAAALALGLLPAVSLAQSVSGLVRDAEGAPLPGASVRVAGAPLGATTGIDGRYTLRLPTGTYRLAFSFIGYESQERALTLASGEDVTLDVDLAERTLALDGLVVSSQRRLQQIQDVPVAVTAFSGDFIEQIDAQEFDVLSRYVPGLEVQIQSVNNPGFVVRGITSDSGDPRLEPRVSVFQDGVSISESRGSVVELFDLERVEVLKGPQGTLFGRGAQIGALHIIQNKPQGEFDAGVEVGTGSFQEVFAEGFVNAPIVEGRLFGRVAGIYNQRDGFVENLGPGGDLNGKETLAFRGGLRWLPTDRTVVDLIGNWQQDTPPGTSFRTRAFTPEGVDPGDLSDRDPANFGDDAVLDSDELFIDRTVGGVTLLADHQLAPRWTLNSVSAFRAFDSLERFDADGTPAPVLQFDEDAEGTQFSQELRATYNGERLSGFVGANVFADDGTQRVPFRTDEGFLLALFAGQLIAPDGSLVRIPVLLNPATGQPVIGPDGQPIPLRATEEAFINSGSSTAYELFGDVTARVLPRLDATLGLRLIVEDITAGYEVEDVEGGGRLGALVGAGANNLFATTNGERIEASDTFTDVVGRAALDYAVSDGANVFATVARGRRPNVLNVSASAVTELAAEIVWSYEAGVKGVALDDRFEYVASAFLYDYSNFRTSVDTVAIGSGTNIEEVFRAENSGSATGLGFEANGRAILVDGVSAFASYGYIDATFDETDSEGRAQELAGNRFRLTPEHSFSLGASFEAALPGVGRAYLRPDYTWKSAVFFEEDNQEEISQDAYGLLNLRAGLALPGGRLRLEGFAENLLDEDYIIDAGNTGGAFGIPTFIAGPPRLVGVRLGARL